MPSPQAWAKGMELLLHLQGDDRENARSRPSPSAASIFNPHIYIKTILDGCIFCDIRKFQNENIFDRLYYTIMFFQKKKTKFPFKF